MTTRKRWNSIICIMICDLSHRAEDDRTAVIRSGTGADKRNGEIQRNENNSRLEWDAS